jgi:hypothetical protein
MSNLYRVFKKGGGANSGGSDGGGGGVVDQTVVAGSQNAVSGGGVATAIAAANVSPAFSGTPTAPTAAQTTSNTQIATTAYCTTKFAPKASPAFSGTPIAPTAPQGTNSTQLATTAFVATAVASASSGGGSYPSQLTFPFVIIGSGTGGSWRIEHPYYTGIPLFVNVSTPIGMSGSISVGLFEYFDNTVPRSNCESWQIELDSYSGNATNNINPWSVDWGTNPGVQRWQLYFKDTGYGYGFDVEVLVTNFQGSQDPAFYRITVTPSMQAQNA